MTERSFIDGLQYARWSEKIFRQMAEAGMSAVHVTICYHETFRETVANIEAWNRHFAAYPDLIRPAGSGDEIRAANAAGCTAIIFGAQNCSPIDDDLGLVEIMHRLGLRFMQLSYNNQSLLASGCYENDDTGITRMGRKVIGEMNRVGMVIDMSHSAERSTREAIDLSSRPIAITHANPAGWHPARRNKSDALLKALAARGGMLGFSLYPHHLKGGASCSREEFCAMIARTAEVTGAGQLGIGSDLCQDQPDSVVHWMRNGRWTFDTDFGEGSAAEAGFPPQPSWFRDIRDFPGLGEGLREVGFSREEIDAILGGNWMRFIDDGFGPGV